MDLKNLKLFAMVQQRMGWLAQRQEVLADNIANADTPAFRPNDLKELDFSRQLRAHAPSPVLAQTRANHIVPPGREAPFRTEATRDSYEVTPAGNAVNLEQQMMKVAETQASFRLATNLYSKHVSLLKDAIGRGRG